MVLREASTCAVGKGGRVHSWIACSLDITDLA